MRALPIITLAVAILMLAPARAVADDPPRNVSSVASNGPDYSHERLLRLFREQEQRTAQLQAPYQWHFEVGRSKLGLLFMPLLLPLAGTGATSDTLAPWPNPFELLGTSYPYTAQMFRYPRTNREIRSTIRRVEREKRAQD